MQQGLRLNRSEDIKRVRQEGRSLANAILVLVYLSKPCDQTKVAVVAGKSVGGAVQRNFAKRRIRSAFQMLFLEVEPGYDLVLIARKPILEADYQTIVDSLKALLLQAKIIKEAIN